jgi:hypothetical protein
LPGEGIFYALIRAACVEPRRTQICSHVIETSYDLSGNRCEISTTFFFHTVGLEFNLNSLPDDAIHASWFGGVGGVV